MTGVFVNSASESTLRLNVICEIRAASCDGNWPTLRAGTPGLPLINERMISLPGTAPTLEGSVRKTPERKGRRTFSYRGPSEDNSSATFALLDAVGLDHVLTLDEGDAQGLGLADRHEGHRGGLAVDGPLGGVEGRTVELIGERQLHVRSRVDGAQGGRQGEEAEEVFHVWVS